MKRILEIINKGSEPCLFTLSNETTYNLGDVFLQPDRVLWQRLQVQNKEIIEQNPEYRKVVAFNITTSPPIFLHSDDQKILKKCVEKGHNFLEVDCDENGYPFLGISGRLDILNTLRSASISMTPTEALQKIKELNESKTRNN
jgi:hypothetical protein